MKKIITILTVLTAVVLLVTACGKNGSSTDDKKIIVGASNVPHSKILEVAKPLLKEKGYDLEIKVFQDYILPNTALANKEIDANYFQHVPYLNTVLEEHKDYKFVNAGGIHIEPIGVYSQKYKSLKDLPQNGLVILGDAEAEQGRILSIFEREGVIKLKSGVDAVTARISDIADNPKNLTFKADVERGLLPQVFKNNEGDAVVINANYAIDAGLDPVKDPIAVESKENNPFANIITVREGDEKLDKIKALVEALHSKEVQDFINTTYKGAVVPVDN